MLSAVSANSLITGMGMDIITMNAAQAQQGVIEQNSSAILLQLNALNTAVNAPIPAGTNQIGSVALINPTAATGLVHGTTGTTAITSTTSTVLLAAVSSTRIYVTHVDCFNTSGSTSTYVVIQDGSAGTALGILSVGSNYNGEASHAGYGSALYPTTSGNGLYVAAGTSANIYCSASGYTGS